MALWDALAPAATVAQLVGADAAGLVSATLQAVRTARRNRKECHSLARRVMMVGDLLRLVQAGSETMQRPEVGRALDGLGAALRRAYELVESCQERGAVYGFVMAGRQAEQFRDVQGEIDSYLLVFPVVSHIDITIRLDRIYSMLLPLPPSQSQQVSEAVLGSPTSHLGSDTRNEQDIARDFQSESNQIVQPFDVEEHQGPGHEEGLEEPSTREPQEDISAYDLSKDAADTYYDLLKAAKIIGSGGYSTIYRAHVRGLDVAIKIFGTTKSCVAHYDSEVHILAKLQHTNIIKFLGHYPGSGKHMLVYEYMPNKSLDKFIFDVRSGVSLDWLSRFRIIQGIALGLLYLHTHTKGCIVHRDLKPSNILLDSDMNAKISDFGTAQMLSSEWLEVTSITGTYSYMAPEYVLRGILSTKADVYAYGVILLEVIAAKKCSVPGGDAYLHFTERAWHMWTTGRSFELLDPSLRDHPRTTEITRCIQIALLCVQNNPGHRPSMSDVLLMLGNRKIIPAPNCPTEGSQFRRFPAENRAIKMPRADNSDGEMSGGYTSEAVWNSSDFTWPR